MKNVKQIWEENKVKVAVGVGVGIAVTSVILTKKYYKANFHIIPICHRAISWKPTGKFITVESAKAALDLNVNNNSSFAVIKDGAKYVGVVLSDGVVLP